MVFIPKNENPELKIIHCEKYIKKNGNIPKNNIHNV